MEKESFIIRLDKLSRALESEKIDFPVCMFITKEEKEEFESSFGYLVPMTGEIKLTPPENPVFMTVTKAGRTIYLYTVDNWK